MGWLPDLLPSGYFTYCGCDPVANVTINLDLLRLIAPFEIYDEELEAEGLPQIVPATNHTVPLW